MKKGTKSSPLWQIMGTKQSNRAPRSAVFREIQNGGRSFTLDWLNCLGWRRTFNNCVGFSFNWGQSYVATMVTPQKFTKMIRNILYNFQILASDPKKFFGLMLITGNVLENLEQLVESPSPRGPTLERLRIRLLLFPKGIFTLSPRETIRSVLYKRHYLYWVSALVE